MRPGHHARQVPRTRLRPRVARSAGRCEVVRGGRGRAAVLPPARRRAIAGSPHAACPTTRPAKYTPLYSNKKVSYLEAVVVSTGAEPPSQRSVPSPEPATNVAVKEPAP